MDTMFKRGTWAVGIFGVSIAISTSGCFSEEDEPAPYSTPTTTTSSSSSTTDGSSSLSDPIVLIPAESVYASNQDLLSISGSCTDGTLVDIRDEETATVESVSCVSSAFSSSLSKSVDGSYNYSVRGRNEESSTNYVTRKWIRDTQAPSAPSVTKPGASPYTSGDDSLVLEGGCESGAIVNVLDLSIASSSQVNCVSDWFSYTTETKIYDGDYDFELFQTDIAGNRSGTTTWRWSRSGGLPETPVITSPSTSPYYSNSPGLIISGSCTGGYTVELSGSASQTTICDEFGNFSFSVSAAAEGSFDYSVVQYSSAGATVSAAASLNWIYDATAPAAPELSSPVPVASGGVGSHTSYSDITISGNCESGATVSLSGSTTQSIACSSSSFSFDVTMACGQTLSYFINQTDLAANSSGSTQLDWTKDCTALPEPVLLSPSANPHVSSSKTLTVSGGCDNGMTVVLSGDVAAPEKVTCVDSSFSFAIDKTADNSPAVRYDFSVHQQDSPDAPTQTSASVALTWIRNGVYQTAALYHFDSYSGALSDSSHYSENGLSDTATQSAAGMFSEGRDFVSANTSYLSASNSDSLRTARHYFTLEAWIQLQSLPKKAGAFVIAEKEGSWKLSLNRQGGSQNYYFEFAAAEELGGSCSATASFSSAFFTPTPTVPETSFKKITVLFELGNISVYYGGALIISGVLGTAGNAELCDSAAGGLFIGSDSGTSSFFDGKMDELSISQKIRQPNRTGPFSAD